MHPNERDDLLHSQMIEYINRSRLFFHRTENTRRMYCASTMKHGTLDLILQTAHVADASILVVFFYLRRLCAIRQKQSSNILNDVDINTCRDVNAM